MANFSGSSPTSTGQMNSELQAWGQGYLCPPQEAKAEDRLQWLKEQVRLSRAYLESQRAFPDIERALDLVAGETAADPINLLVGRSKIRINRLKRQIREIVATLTDFRLVGEFKTHNRDFYNNLSVLRKLYLGWHHRKQIRKELRRVFQYTAVQGTGYASPRPALEYGNVAGPVEIELDAYGALGVLPHQLGRDHDLQKAYAVSLFNEIPYHNCLALYPNLRDFIVPSRTRPLYTKSPMQTLARFFSPVLHAFGLGQSKESEPSPFPMVDVYQTYVQDLSINSTGKTIAMGEPGTSWYYEVPSLGQELPTGEKDLNGQPTYRKASYEDAMLYPLRRLIIWTDTVVIYDGTSKVWHGLVPAVQFRMDDWPWDFLGYSLVRDNASIQETVNTLLRGVVDKMIARSNPPIGYSKSIDKGLATRLDPLQPGQRIQLDENMGETMKALMEPGYYDIPPWWLEFFKVLNDTMDHQMGVADMIALAKAKKQAPGGDTLDKLLEAAGPLIKDITSNIESSVEQLVYMVMCLMFQFYTTPRKVQLIGADQITPEEYDYEPGQLIPSHMPGEDITKPSMRGLLERARHHMRQFWFWVEPGSLLNITGMTRQLMLAQLMKLGLPISWWTMMEAMGLPFAPEPEGAKNELEKWIAQKRLEAGIASEFQQATQGGGKGGAGRPQSFQQPPKQVQRGDGSQTVRTSR